MSADVTVDPPKAINETITLDSTNDTDIIECSVSDSSNKNSFFKTPRSHLKRKCTPTSKNKVISLKGYQFKYDNLQLRSPGNDKINTSLKCKLRSSFKIDDSASDVSIISASTPGKGTNGRGGKANPVVNRLLSNIKKTPDLPYLSRSRLSRVEKWLVDNEVETVRTPPFSNVSGTPVSLRPRQSSSSVKASPPKRFKSSSESDSGSSIDPEVEKVLVAVYGNDWRKKNVVKKSKTEPKRSKSGIAPTKTDIKTNRVRTEVKDKPVRTARRNIMKNVAGKRGTSIDGKSDNLDNSFSLGVGKLNDSGTSDELIVRRSVTTGRRRRLKSSSSESWEPQSVRKKKGEGTRKCLEKKTMTTQPSEDVKQGASSGRKTPMKTFLASLSVSTPKRQCHPEAQDFKINFKTKKEELAKKLFQLYNAEVFGGALPDDMNFSWNVKLRGTAGYCYNKKLIKSTGQIIRFSRIEFSTKIIDRADRLRDTLIHELCHAASWVVDGVLDGHGSFWTKWARKAMDRFPELPTIKRCHNYEIASKYTYKCTGCGYSINRHSKSIDTERKRCGHCFGVLELFVNKKKRGKGEVPEFDSTRTLSAPNSFALFVKENYQNVKSAKKDAKHAEIMKILSQKYALAKESGTWSAKK